VQEEKIQALYYQYTGTGAMHLTAMIHTVNRFDGYSSVLQHSLYAQMWFIFEHNISERLCSGSTCILKDGYCIIDRLS
jgi:hypothetical protein